MLSPDDRQIVELFARRVRARVPSAAIWAFGSRVRGSAHPESDLDLCVVLAEATRELQRDIREIAWEVGFEQERVIAPLILSADDFLRGPMSASTLVATIRREGVAA